MFRRLPDGAQHLVTVTVDGRAVRVPAGEMAAGALYEAGLAACRTTPVKGRPRGPWCMMGVCFDCLVVIDGMPNRQACLTPVVEGMTIQRQDGAREIAPMEIEA